MQERTYRFGESSLTLRFGDITDSDADVVVSSDDFQVSMGGGVSAAILRKGGVAVLTDASKMIPAKLGDVVVTTAGELRAKHVFHAITIGDASESLAPSDVLRNTLARCFDLLEVLRLKSIAFPAIGAGLAGFKYQEVAIEMAEAVGLRLRTSKRPLEVTIYLFDRFGRMKPLDYVDFFAEVRARSPQVAEHEVTTDEPPEKRREKKEPADNEIPARHRLASRLAALGKERDELETQLALESADAEGETRVRRRLREIESESVSLRGELASQKNPAVALFFSYAREDVKLRDRLAKHLVMLERQGIISGWHDGEISAGTDWEKAITDQLESAQIILLLISVDFMASDYAYGVEMQRALERHESGDARVIPVILSPAMWSKAPFASLQALPTNGEPVTKWQDQESALLDIAEGIREAAESLLAESRRGARR